MLGPDDKPVAMASILIDEGDGAAAAVALDAAGRMSIVRAMSGSDGSFSVFVPGDRPVRLRVTHPLMRPDPEHGSVEVLEPVVGLVLRLVKGPVLAYVVDSSEFGDKSDFGAGPRVLLFDGSLEAEPLSRLTPIYDPASSAPDPRKLRYRAGGFEAGRRTVWIDLLAGAPIVLYGVDLSDGDTDLGEVRPARGAAVRVKTARVAGQDPVEVYVNVQAISGPSYVRSAHSRDGEVVVTGLLRGRFRVSVRGPPNSGFEASTHTIDCDGEHDVVIDSSQR